MSVTVICWLVVLGLATPRTAEAAFGDPLTHGRDDIFEKMGQAKVDKFEVEEGQVSLDVSLEDTEGQDEIWVLDFQDFGKSPVAQWPIRQADGGSLVSEATGTCSNVFSTVSYHNKTGFYKDEFRPTLPGSKSLFNSFQTTDNYITKGDIKIREDHLMFDGSMDTMFLCRDTDNKTIWQQEVTPDTIQFNTTLYMTNIRPQGTSNNPEPAFVQSFAILYWRLLRVALSRFLISSTERLKPIFEYAIVRPVFLNDDGESFDRQRAEVEIVFRTVTSHPNGSLVSVFNSGSLTYSPADSLTGNKLLHIKQKPSRGCNRPLGVYSGDITDPQIVASTMWLGLPEYGGDKGRLRAEPDWPSSAGAWVAGSADVNQWVQVLFDADTWCSGVQTQGYVDQDTIMWVTEYVVAYSTQISGAFSEIVDDTGVPVVFDGNFDSGTIVTNYFKEPVQARRLRILPQSWDNSIALRFEILGCDELSECYTSGDQSDYRGTVSVANTGDVCEPWPSTEVDVDALRAEGVGDHNFCRRASGGETAGCFTAASDEAVDCDVGPPQISCPVSEFEPADAYANYAPSCNYTEWNGQCTQRWAFIMVLEVDASQATSGMPIDATGEFTFNFDTYDCANSANDRSNCRRLDIPAAIISNEITLQTTVEVTDDTKDSPRVYLKKVHGSDPTVDIRGGVLPGVSHLEQVTMDTHFFPQFLRDRLELQLTLFMVCIGEEYNTGDGCLVAPPGDSYTAYVSTDFTYRLASDPDNPIGYSSITTSAQSLDSHSYLPESEVHRILFTNKALSAKSRKYTITTVYRLVQRSGGRRRRRDVRDRVDRPVAVHQALLFRGCPPNSTHDPQALACVCTNAGEKYSPETFACKRPLVLDERIVPVDGDDGETNSADDDIVVGDHGNSGAASIQSAATFWPVYAITLAIVALLCRR